MRIISGEYKYRKLELPADIRPTTEKVREAVLSMVCDQISGAAVLDLFAGSGSLGLETLSRGAERCVFNEVSRKNFIVLKKNIAACNADVRATAYNSDFRKFLCSINERFDIVFLDPPYAAGFYDQSFQLLHENGLLKQGALIVAEHLYNNKLLEQYQSAVRVKEKKYGTIGVDVYKEA